MNFSLNSNEWAQPTKKKTIENFPAHTHTPHQVKVKVVRTIQNHLVLTTILKLF